MLRLVIAQLRRTPKAYNQNATGVVCNKDKEKPSCGTAACICGWLVYFRTRSWTKKKLRQHEGIPSKDYALMYLTWEQWERLYWFSHWPEQFRNVQCASEVQAKDAIARLTHFLKTDGRE